MFAGLLQSFSRYWHNRPSYLYKMLDCSKTHNKATRLEHNDKTVSDKRNTCCFPSHLTGGRYSLTWSWMYKWLVKHYYHPPAKCWQLAYSTGHFLRSITGCPILLEEMYVSLKIRKVAGKFDSWPDCGFESTRLLHVPTLLRTVTLSPASSRPKRLSPCQCGHK